jgi:predicted RNA-binding protein with PUA domain
MLGKRKRRLTKELKENGKKELHSELIIVKLQEVEPHCNKGKTIAET